MSEILNEAAAREELTRMGVIVETDIPGETYVQILERLRKADTARTQGYVSLRGAGEIVGLPE
jgi:hypothetical protein